MAQCVNLCEETEQAAELVAVLRDLKQDGSSAAEAAAWAKPFDELVQSSNTPELLRKLSNDAEQRLILSCGHASVIENVYSAFAVLLFKLDPSSRDDFARALFDQLRQSHEGPHAGSRLRAMTFIYNVLPQDSAYRRDALVHFLEFAHKANQLQLVKPLAKQLLTEDKPAWTPQQLRALYKSLATLLGAAPELKQLAFNAQVRLLESFDEQAASSPEASQAAQDATLLAITNSSVFQFDQLLRLPAVSAMQKSSDARSKEAVQLLEVFAHGDLAGFNSLISSNSTLLSSWKLDEAMCRKKMRLLSLTSLGNKQGDVSYSVIANALDIKENEVEGWVIMAIGSGLIDAKLDQQARVVRVSRATHRTFTENDWQSLRSQLSAWSDSLNSMLPVLHTNVAAAASASISAQIQ